MVLHSDSLNSPQPQPHHPAGHPEHFIALVLLSILVHCQLTESKWPKLNSTQKKKKKIKIIAQYLGEWSGVSRTRWETFQVSQNHCLILQHSWKIRDSISFLGLCSFLKIIILDTHFSINYHHNEILVFKTKGKNLDLMMPHRGRRWVVFSSFCGLCFPVSVSKGKLMLLQ